MLLLAAESMRTAQHGQAANDVSADLPKLDLLQVCNRLQRNRCVVIASLAMTKTRQG